MYLHTKTSILAHVDKAKLWTGRYLVPNLDNNGELVAVRSKSKIRMTTVFHEIKDILTEAGHGELCIHGATPDPKKKTNVYCRLQCPTGRTEKPQSANAEGKVPDDDEGSPESQTKGKKKMKGAGGKTNQRTKTQRGTGCGACINAIWKDTKSWEQQLLCMEQGGEREVFC